MLKLLLCLLIATCAVKLALPACIGNRGNRDVPELGGGTDVNNDELAEDIETEVDTRNTGEMTDGRARPFARRDAEDIISLKAFLDGNGYKGKDEKKGGNTKSEDKKAIDDRRKRELNEELAEDIGTEVDTRNAEETKDGMTRPLARRDAEDIISLKAFLDGNGYKGKDEKKDGDTKAEDKKAIGDRRKRELNEEISRMDRANRIELLARLNNKGWDKKSDKDGKEEKGDKRKRDLNGDRVRVERANRIELLARLNNKGLDKKNDKDTKEERAETRKRDLNGERVRVDRADRIDFLARLDHDGWGVKKDIKGKNTETGKAN